MVWCGVVWPRVATNCVRYLEPWLLPCALCHCGSDNRMRQAGASTCGAGPQHVEQHVLGNRQRLGGDGTSNTTPHHTTPPQTTSQPRFFKLFPFFPIFVPLPPQTSLQKLVGAVLCRFWRESFGGRTDFLKEVVFGTIRAIFPKRRGKPTRRG